MASTGVLRHTLNMGGTIPGTKDPDIIIINKRTGCQHPSLSVPNYGCHVTLHSCHHVFPAMTDWTIKPKPLPPFLSHQDRLDHQTLSPFRHAYSTMTD